MQSLKYMVLFFGFLFLIFWLAGPQKPRKLLTAGSCVELTDRIWNRPNHNYSNAEGIDMKDCDAGDDDDQAFR